MNALTGEDLEIGDNGQLCFGNGTGLAVVAAHPDDEVIGAGAQLSSWRNAQFIYVTDGAPRNLRDAKTAGFTDRRDYAAARQAEVQTALGLAGIEPAQITNLGFADQESALNLVALVKRLLALWHESRPQMVLTHAYEGGHPDHDATAFAVHAACRLLHEGRGVKVEVRAENWRPSSLAPRPSPFEMTSYHNRAGIMATGEFLPCADHSVTELTLTAEQCRFKQRLFDCFKTQQNVLKWFPIERESFRPAPAYDFTQPPHEGQLYYELFDWGMTGARWRELARQALEDLGLDGAKCGRSLDASSRFTFHVSPTCA